MNKPTDAEILDTADDFRSQYMHGGITFDEFDSIGFAHAVLAKWGAPAPVGVEPVARLEIGKTKGGVSRTHIAEPAAFQLQEGMYALYIAPQPAPATQQAGVALSDDLRDRLVAISEAIADQDDRAAQAMLREILNAPQADSQPAPVVNKRTKQQMTTEVLRRMQQQEDGHNKNPFRSLLDRLMRNEGGYSTIEIGQLKYALDGFYGAVRAPAESVGRDAAFEAVRKRLCALPRYSFMLVGGGSIRRVQDRTGNWIEFDDAHELFDPVAIDAALAAQGDTP